MDRLFARIFVICSGSLFAGIAYYIYTNGVITLPTNTIELSQGETLFLTIFYAGASLPFFKLAITG